jgi:hypothetical protein
MPSRTVSPVSTWAETGGLNDHAVRLENLNSLSQSHHTKRALTRESLNSLTTVSITRPLKSHSLTPLYAEHRGESETRHETETGSGWPNQRERNTRP